MNWPASIAYSFAIVLACDSFFTAAQKSNGQQQQRQSLDCEAGVGEYDGRLLCATCPSGFYAVVPNTDNSYVCAVCDAGKEATNNGMSECTQCKAGRFKEEIQFVGQTVSSQNRNLQKSSSEASTPSPHSNSLPATTGATPSSSVTSKIAPTEDDDLESAIVNMEIGGSLESTLVEEILYGLFGNDFKMGSLNCQTCLEGTFANTSALHSCEHCPAGKAANRVGQTKCTDCAAGSYSSPGWQSCLECEAGQFANDSRATACAQCSLGKVSKQRRAHACESCPEGTRGTSENQCVSCTAGRFSDVNGSSECAKCLAGKYSHPSIVVPSLGLIGIIHCVECKPGEFSDNVGSGMCKACPAGTYSNTTGTTKCMPCSEGKYANSGWAICESCDRGYFSSLQNSTACSSCTPGKFSDIVAASECTPCSAGKYNDNEARSGCSTCASGSYATGVSNLGCSACAEGQFASGRGMESCEICSAGKFANGTASTACHLCPQGTYSSTLGADRAGTCIPCGSGKFASAYGADGADICEPCLPGRYASGEGDTMCLNCPAGTYNAHNGAKSFSDCSGCAKGKYSTVVAAVSPEVCIACPGVGTTPGVASISSDECDCIEDHFLPPGKNSTSDCTLCPASLDCPGKRELPTAKPGYYLATISDNKPLVLTCRLDGGKVCKGGIETAEEARCSGGYKDCPGQCLNGHVGYMCGRCDIGWAQDRFPKACEECLPLGVSGTTMILGYFLTATFYVAVAALQAISTRSKTPALYTIALRSFNNWCLTIYHLGSVDLSKLELISWSAEVQKERDEEFGSAGDGRHFLDFPEELESIVNWLYVMTGQLPELMQVVSPQRAIACLAHEHGWNAQMAPAIYWSFLHVPIVLVAAIIVSFVVYLFASCIGQAKASLSKVHTDAEDSDDEEVCNEESLTLGLFRPHSSLTQIFFQSEPCLLVVLYGLWPQVTMRNLLGATCLPLTGAEGGREDRLRTNPDIHCWESLHLQLCFVTGCGFLLWTVAPLVYVYQRIASQKTKKYTPAVAAKYGYFYSGLEPRCWWWELVVKRTDIAVFMCIAYLEHSAFRDDRAKLIWFTFLSGMMLAVHERYHPYDGRQCHLMDFLESLALANRFLTYLLVSSLLLSEASFFFSWAIGISIIVFNVLFIAYNSIQITFDAGVTMLEKYREQQELEELTGGVADKNPGHSTTRQSLMIVREKANTSFYSCLRMLFGAKQRAMEDVTHIKWLGPVKGVKFVEPDLSKKNSSFVVRLIFRLDNRRQHRYFVRLCADFQDYIISCVGMDTLPAMHFDIFVLLALARQKVASAALAVDSTSLLIGVDEILEEHCAKPLRSEDLMQLNLSLYQLDDISDIINETAAMLTQFAIRSVSIMSFEPEKTNETNGSVRSNVSHGPVWDSTSCFRSKSNLGQGTEKVNKKKNLRSKYRASMESKKNSHYASADNPTSSKLHSDTSHLCPPSWHSAADDGVGRKSTEDKHHANLHAVSPSASITGTGSKKSEDKHHANLFAVSPCVSITAVGSNKSVVENGLSVFTPVESITEPQAAIAADRIDSITELD